MPRTMRRRELLATATLGSAAVALPCRVNAYNSYDADQFMRAPLPKDGESIWQWLLLLIDASSSMTRRFDRMSFYEMQIEATARALMEPCVVGRFIGSPQARIALRVVLWSASQQHKIAVHWKVIRSTEDVSMVASRLRHTANYLDSYTGVAGAVRFATSQLKAAYIPATSRKIINITANGRDNQDGDPLAAARAAEEAGIAINAVVMRGYDGTVDDMYRYYENNVITKDGLIFKVENEDMALEALVVANASKFCAEVALAPSCVTTPA